MESGKTKDVSSDRLHMRCLSSHASVSNYIYDIKTGTMWQVSQQHNHNQSEHFWSSVMRDIIKDQWYFSVDGAMPHTTPQKILCHLDNNSEWPNTQCNKTRKAQWHIIIIKTKDTEWVVYLSDCCRRCSCWRRSPGDCPRKSLHSSTEEAVLFYPSPASLSLEPA